MSLNGDNALERKVLRHEIKQIIINAIFSGELSPGDRIVETRIARELNVSQAPVREAIRELEQIGLVETKPYKGAFVNKINKNEVYEAYKLRSLLEGYAAQVLATTINTNIIQGFKTLIAKMKESALENNRTKFIENDVAFHEYLIKSTDSKLLYRVWSVVRMAHLPYLTLSKSGISLDDLVKEHEKIVNAFEEKNAEKAAIVVRNHIEELGDNILKIL